MNPKQLLNAMVDDPWRKQIFWVQILQHFHFLFHFYVLFTQLQVWKCSTSEARAYGYPSRKKTGREEERTAP